MPGLAVYLRVAVCDSLGVSLSLCDLLSSSVHVSSSFSRLGQCIHNDITSVVSLCSPGGWCIHVSCIRMFLGGGGIPTLAYRMSFE